MRPESWRNVNEKTLDARPSISTVDPYALSLCMPDRSYGLSIGWYAEYNYSKLTQSCLDFARNDGKAID